MKENEYLARLHAEMMDIMDEIVRVCTIIGARYYLIGGTLLGAVRHGGFIPWDDDFDIVMPREDFSIFIDNCEKLLSHEYRLSWSTTNPRHARLFAKISKVGTSFVEQIGKSQIDWGIFVDIFPADYADAYGPAVERRKKQVKLIGNMLHEKQAQTHYGRFKKTVLKLFPYRFLLSLASRIMQSGNTCPRRTCYVNYGSQYPVKRQTINIDFFGAGRQLQFENRTYNVPVEYHEVLKTIFGNNYMVVPPPEKRRIHYPIHVRFSNGDLMEFSQPSSKISLLDSL